jgi:hypothetical protein
MIVQGNTRAYVLQEKFGVDINTLNAAPYHRAGLPDAYG